MPDEYLGSLSATERAAEWRSALENPPRDRATRLVAVVDDEVVGFALVGPADDAPDTGELYALNVDPDHWGTGVGPALIDAAMDALRASGFASAVLWVHPDNERARSFYSRPEWSYSAAWVLVHYLLHGEDGALRDGFARWLVLEGRGQGGPAALYRELGLNLEQLEAGATAHLKRLKAR